MASLSEAFEEFSAWSDSKTSPKVTVIERDQPEDVLAVRICGLDEDASLVELLESQCTPSRNLILATQTSLSSPTESLCHVKTSSG
jgi:hypothetical protein